MTQAQDRISTIQAIMILISYVGINDHVTVIPVLLRTAGRDAWISVLLAGILIVICVPVLHTIMRRSGQVHILAWVRQTAGPFLAALLAVVFICQMFVTAYVTIQDSTTWLYMMYLYLTPKTILTIIFCLICLYQVRSGIRSIAIVNGLLLPFVIVFGFFVMSANIPNKNYALLLPILENGINPVLHGFVPAGAGMFDIILLLLFQQRLKRQVKKGWLFFLTLFTVMLMLGPLTGAIAEFGPYEGGELRYTASEEWRIVSFSHNFEHVDFLSIYQWMVGSFIRASITIYLIPEILQIKTKKKRNLTLYLVMSLLLLLLLIPVEDEKFLSYVSDYFLPYTFWAAFAVLMILFAISFVKKKKGGESREPVQPEARIG